MLGSGSSGNALLVESRGTRVLLEAGIGPRVAASRLAELGVEIRPGELDGIVATHEHGDHFAHATKLATAFDAPLFVHAKIRVPSPCGAKGTEQGGCSERAPGAAASKRRPHAALTLRGYDVGRSFRIGELRVTTVEVPHDAPQVAVRIDDGAHAFGLATDVGRVTPGLVGLLSDCDAALVEANHCPEMLWAGPYPESVKRRVTGGIGHLSNQQTAELAARLVGSRLARMWLGHLSRTNNTPERALEVVSHRARRIDVEVLPPASPVAFSVRSTRPYQLGLPF